MNLRRPSTSTTESSLNRSVEQCSALFQSLVAAQRGIALVITLILLAVITTLAIAFLGLTRRETQAVDSMARTTDAEMAADSGLERAKAQIIAGYRVRNGNHEYTNDPAGKGIDLGPDIFVSVAWQTNRTKDLTNYLDSSVPVFASTTNGPDDRFYLDLNRNRHFEDSGWVPVTDDAFQPVRDTSGNVVTNFLVGDPQWIGVLQNPRLSHGPNNHYIARQAFMVLPAGRSLDVNWIHNHALGASSLSSFNLDMRPGQNNGFYRNQGVGGWEVNLGAFFADLNLNYWGADYSFAPFNRAIPNAIATGVAFDDASEVLRYRYAPRTFADVFTLPSSHHTYLNKFEELFLDAPSRTLFANDNIDGYSTGPATSFATLNADSDITTQPWPGAASHRRISSLHDWFDKQKLREAAPIPNGLRYRMEQASARGNTYDRYTYYRMLSQLGTESVEEDEGKININYVNVPSWVNPSFRYYPNRLVSWTNTTPAFVSDMGRTGPELFLLTVVTNLLAREPRLAFMVTNAAYGIPLRIPIYTNRSTINTNARNNMLTGPLYSGRVHQILQLAANIFDATTGPKASERFPYFPTIFRPQFEVAGGEVYITNYVIMDESADDFITRTVTSGNRWRNLDADGPAGLGRDDGVLGIPLIIGARKGYPNFNELGIVTEVSVTRRLEFGRATASSQVVTNQILTVTITNQIGYEARNSYLERYSRDMEIRFYNRMKSDVTNSPITGPRLSTQTNWLTGHTNFFPAGTWGGIFDTVPNTFNTYKVSPILRQSVLNYEIKTAPEPGGPVTNLWGMALTNGMLFFMIDRPSGRIIDAVSLNGPRNFFNIASELGDELRDAVTRNPTFRNIWNNSRDTTTGTSRGVSSQIIVSKGQSRVEEADWTDYATIGSKSDATPNFRSFLDETNYAGRVGTNNAPFTPTRVMVMTNYFRVNDPLVHYTMEDLYPTSRATTIGRNNGARQVQLGSRNPETVPWNDGDDSTQSASPGLGATDPTLRDPGVFGSFNWDFPTNHFPTIGWLGRVHRGTPWQTIYLKSELPGRGNWAKYSSPTRFEKSAASAALMLPARDWELLDLFTTAPHPNATRGRLSINQTQLAAWSAALSGIVANGGTNVDVEGTVHVYPSPELVGPAAVGNPDPQLNLMSRIVRGINQARASLPSKRFTSLGSLMKTPELTYASPYLNNGVFDATKPNGTELVTDSAYERIPEQILSLLKVGEPRFVIYSWGQSLKPARQGVDTTVNPLRLSGPSINPDDKIVNNYQVTGESATRTVVRVVFPEKLDAPVAGPGHPFYGTPDYRKPRVVVESFNVIPLE